MFIRTCTLAIPAFARVIPCFRFRTWIVTIVSRAEIFLPPRVTLLYRHVFVAITHTLALHAYNFLFAFCNFALRWHTESISETIVAKKHSTDFSFSRPVAYFPPAPQAPAACTHMRAHRECVCNAPCAASDHPHIPRHTYCARGPSALWCTPGPSSCKRDLT